MAVATTTLAIGLIAGGGAMQAVGHWKSGTAAKKQGEAAQRAAESQAELLDYNAQVADVQAQDALERGALDESRYRSQVRGLIGSQRASFAGQGVEVSEGSALDVQEDAAYLGELDSLQIRQNAMRQAWGYQVEAFDLRERARITRLEGAAALEAGKAAQSAARLNAVGSVLGTGANLALMKYGFERDRRAGSDPYRRVG